MSAAVFGCSDARNLAACKGTGFPTKPEFKSHNLQFPKAMEPINQTLYLERKAPETLECYCRPSGR